MNFTDLFGNLSSLVILISLTMSSIIKLRWLNLIGGAMFTAYGVLLGSIPVIFLNLGIVVIDIYYLYKLYSTKESFKLVDAILGSPYLNHFMDVNKKELQIFEENLNWSDNEKVFYMLRDNNTAGVLAGREEGESLFIDLDYVTPKYRDMKLGKYFFNENKEVLKNRGYKTLKTKGTNAKHREYLEKIGFRNVSDDLYEKEL